MIKQTNSWCTACQCFSHLPGCFFYEQPSTAQPSEFDRVFEDMSAPEYPATCDGCGELGTEMVVGAIPLQERI